MYPPGMAPVNLPPWSPGMAPPIPGPVFSQAFIALLVLMGGGCCVLCYQLYDKLGAAMGSKIGEDNEILVGGRGAEGGADWLRGVQASRGRVAVRLPESGLRAGDARARGSGGGGATAGGAKKKSKKAGGRRPEQELSAVPHTDEEAAPIAAPRRKAKGGGAKSSRTSKPPRPRAGGGGDCD